MITLNKIALALFVGLGPIFIMCLLFDQTKSLFQRWLLYGIGTLFSLAVLYVMVYLAMDLTLAVAGALFAGQFLTLAGGQGISNMSMQLGSLGIILTMLLISAPPMAAAFFQGTLGQFMHYSVFGGMDRDGFRNSPGARGPAGEPYGAMGRNDARNPGGNTGAYNPGSSYASNTPTYSHRNLTPSSGPANV
jgi:type IV secretion system protein VirB6